MARRIVVQKTLLLVESGLIFLIMVALVLVVALQVFGSAGIVAVAAGVVMLAFLTLQRGRPEIPRELIPVYHRQAPELYSILKKLSGRAGLKRVPGVYLLPEELMNAATLETREGPLIVLTPMTVQQLNRRQLTGILAHEVAHLEYRDTLLLQLTNMVHTITQSIAQVAWFMLIVFFPLLVLSGGVFPFYLVVLLFIAPVASVLLQMAFSRSREFNADLGAVELTGDPEGLAEALDRIDHVQSYALSQLFPFRRPKQNSSIFRSHPNIPVRIRKLRRIAAEQ
jgi:heat shock protein HtpX